MSSISKVAILLAAYNGENYLSEQLDSILSQKQVEVEVFISLDQSSDGSIDVINEYVKKHKRCALKRRSICVLNEIHTSFICRVNG